MTKYLATLIALMLCISCTAHGEKYSNWSSNRVAVPEVSKGEISVVRGKVSAENIWGSIQCPESYICMDVIFELGIERIKTLYGPTIGIEPLYSVQHGARPDLYRTWLIDRRSDGRLWVLQQGEIVGSAACFDVHPDSHLRNRLIQMGQQFVADVTCFPDQQPNG